MVQSAAQLANLGPPFGPNNNANPLGRKSYGARVGDWVLLFTGQMDKGEMTVSDLNKIARKDENGNKRAAAIRLIRSWEFLDMADYEPLVSGEMGLAEARAAGVPTEGIKKIEENERFIPQREGDPIREKTRKIELRDTSLSEHQDLSDRTLGKPSQIIQIDTTTTEIRRIEVHFVGDRELRPGERYIEAAADGAGLQSVVDGAALPVVDDRGGAGDSEISVNPDLPNP